MSQTSHAFSNFDSVSALQFLFFTLAWTHYPRWIALLIGKKEKCKEEEEKTRERKRECKKRGIRGEKETQEDTGKEEKEKKNEVRKQWEKN